MCMCGVYTAHPKAGCLAVLILSAHLWHLWTHNNCILGQTRGGCSSVIKHLVISKKRKYSNAQIDNCSQSPSFSHSVLCVVFLVMNQIPPMCASCIDGKIRCHFQMPGPIIRVLISHMTCNKPPPLGQIIYTNSCPFRCDIVFSLHPFL